jgi:hypothetical protein
MLAVCFLHALLRDLENWVQQSDGVTSQNAVFIITTAVITSDLTLNVENLLCRILESCTTIHNKQNIVYMLHYKCIESRESSVGIATGYGLDDQGVWVRVPVFYFSMSSRLALGSTQPPIQWVPGVKRPLLEAGHSPPTSAEVKKMWMYTCMPPYAFMTVLN